MNQDQLREILQNPSTKTLFIQNHEMSNYILAVNSLTELAKELEERECFFIGFQKLNEDLIKRRKYGISDYGMVFEDEDGVFWFHVDSSIIYKFIDFLDLTLKEKEEMKTLYPKTPFPDKNMEEEYDIWDMVGSSMYGGRRR